MRRSSRGRWSRTAITGDFATDARWIFHIGHVGSTLVSRLLGEIEGVLSIREPRLLRDLALTPADVRSRYIAPVPRLMSRTFAETKSRASRRRASRARSRAELVPPGERALFMYATPRNYVASILAGENSVKELHAARRPRGHSGSNARGIYLARPRTTPTSRRPPGRAR